MSYLNRVNFQLFLDFLCSCLFILVWRSSSESAVSRRREIDQWRSWRIHIAKGTKHNPFTSTSLKLSVPVCHMNNLPVSDPDLCLSRTVTKYSFEVSTEKTEQKSERARAAAVSWCDRTPQPLLDRFPPVPLTSDFGVQNFLLFFQNRTEVNWQTHLPQRSGTAAQWSWAGASGLLRWHSKPALQQQARKADRPLGLGLLLWIQGIQMSSWNCRNCYLKVKYY